MSSGSDEYEIGTGGRGDDFLGFSGAGEAEEFLRLHLSDPDDLRKLRMSMTEEGADPEMKNLDDHQILEAAAQRIARGEIRIYPRAVSTPSFAEEEEEKKAAPPEKGEKTWVAFRVVEDAIGKPVPDVKLQLTFADGSQREGVTDPKGRLEFEDVMEGEVTVTSPLRGATHEGTCVYVESGDKPVDEKPDALFSLVKNPESTGPRWLALVAPHEFQEGESLDDAAQAHSVSWKDISFFNWGTTDHDEAVRHLDSRRPPPLANAAPAGEHDEGIPVEIPAEPSKGPTILVSKPIQLRCRTMHSHTVRVRRLANPYAFVSLVLYDDDWSGVLTGKPYRIEGAKGEMFEGVTDKNGLLEHGPVEMAVYRLTVNDVRLAWSPEPTPWIEPTPEAEPEPAPSSDPLPEMDQDLPPEKEAVAGAELPDPPNLGEPEEARPLGDSAVPETSSDALDSPSGEVDESEEREDAASTSSALEEGRSFKPVYGRVTFLVPAVWEYQRPHPQRLPLVLPDLPPEEPPAADGPSSDAATS